MKKKYLKLNPYLDWVNLSIKTYIQMVCIYCIDFISYRLYNFADSVGRK